MSANMAFIEKEGVHYLKCLSCRYEFWTMNKDVMEGMKYCMHCGNEVNDFVTPKPVQGEYSFNVPELDIRKL